MKIRIVGFDGVDEIDVIAPYEVFRHAALLGKDVQTTLVTLDSKSEIITQHGLKIGVDGVLDDQSDLIVVPGGGWVSHSKFGVREQIKQEALLHKLAALHAKGAIIASVCTGAMILAAAGLLKGKEATTHRGALVDLRERGVRVIEERVVDAGDILTCGGVTSSFDLALWIVERFFGAETADLISAYLEYSRSPSVYLSKN